MGANLLRVLFAASLFPPVLPTTLTALPPTIQQPIESLPAPRADSLIASGVAYERLEDAFRYDRVQGLSLGLGYRVRVPGLRFTGIQATVRYGFSDERVTGRITLLHDLAGSRWRLGGYREIASVDPLGRGLGLGNTLNALFAGHDEADYALVEGGSAGLEIPLAPGLDIGAGTRLERQTSVSRQAKSAINDFLGGSGVFPANPPVDQGTYAGGWVRLSGYGGTRWSLTADLLGGEGRTTGRAYGEVKQGLGGRRGLTLRAKAGIASRPTLRQSVFRLGGTPTVRGFDYGTREGQAFWAAQLDVAPFHGRLRPVAFLDAGQAASAEDLFSDTALVGGGIGLSVFSGMVRFDLSHPISPDIGGKVRLDIVVQAAR